MEEEFELELGKDYQISDVYPLVLEFKTINDSILKLIANSGFIKRQIEYLEKNIIENNKN